MSSSLVRETDVSSEDFSSELSCFYCGRALAFQYPALQEAGFKFQCLSCAVINGDFDAD